MKLMTRTSLVVLILLLSTRDGVFANNHDGKNEGNTATPLNQRRRMIRQQQQQVSNHHDVIFNNDDHQRQLAETSSTTASFVADGFLTTPTNKDHIMTTTGKIDVTWEQVVYELFPDSFQANMTQTKQLAHAITEGQTSIPQAPYMNMGHAKQGTTTTHSFFNCLHQKPCHCMIDLPSESDEGSRIQMATCFYEAKKAGKPLLKSCGYPNVCDSYHQMENPYEGLVPQLENLYDMIEEVPHMTLMLPFRNFERWLTSQTNWSANRRNNPGMIHLRDNNCPFVGLKAFESSDQETTIAYGAARQPERFMEQKQKQHWLLQSLEHKESTIFDDEARQTILKLLQYHGIDEAARSALFYVYFVTYVRNFARQHPFVKMIEFDLDDSQTTSDLFQQIFQLSEEQKKCWRHVNTTPQAQQQI